MYSIATIGIDLRKAEQENRPRCIAKCGALSRGVESQTAPRMNREGSNHMAFAPCLFVASALWLFIRCTLRARIHINALDVFKGTCRRSLDFVKKSLAASPGMVRFTRRNLFSSDAQLFRQNELAFLRGPKNPLDERGEVPIEIY